MGQDLTPSIQALLIQATGIVPIAVLSGLLSRSLRRDYLRYWWRAWLALALALFALAATLLAPGGRVILEPLFLLGEYLFAGLILAGCRNLATGERLGTPDVRWLVPAVVLALLLPNAHPDFNVRFIPQATILAILLGIAFFTVRRAPARAPGGIGYPLLSISLAALALSFFHYVPVLVWTTLRGATLPRPYAAYASLLDLLLETLLGFAILITVMEEAHRELEQANRELSAARDRVEAMARVDPLTDSLNRHAFYSMMEGNRTMDGPGPSGCVAVVDLDALKAINDTFGHPSGDTVIRAVGRAIRDVVRADDLVFRWGGDEFLVVLFGVSEEETRRRLEGLNERMAAVEVPGSSEPLGVTVSVGVAAFDTPSQLESAIERADESMYRRKQARRAAGAARRRA